jgi:hypothetical protein
MKRCRFIFSLLLLSGASCIKLAAQEAEFGVTVPVTLTGGVLNTRRAEADDPSAPWLSAGFRVLASPGVKLGPNWYVYAGTLAGVLGGGAGSGTMQERH